MPSPNRIKTLSSGRYLLKCMYLHDRADFFLGSVKVPVFVVYLVSWFPSIYVDVLTSWNIIENFDFGKMSLAAAIAILITCTLLGIATLATNTSTIAMSIDHLQDFIQKSEKSSLFYVLHAHCTEYLSLFDLLGCDKSRTSWEIYNKAERKHTLLFKGLLIYLYAALVTAFSIPLLSPLCYELFGFPQPHQWFLPMEVK